MFRILNAKNTHLSVNTSTRKSFLCQKLVITISLCLLSHVAHAQKPKPYLSSDSFDPTPRGTSGFRIAFYNVENLFDYFDDSLTIDEEFLPNQGRYWTKARYQDKQQKLAKTIIAMGGWEPVPLIGLCEIENRYVLESLTKFTVLKSAGYEIIHKDSPDRRGIDVAALYRPEKFKLINYHYYPLNFPFDPDSRTREILHVIGELPNKDTLHLFVNHWPSKFGGEFETQPKRMFAAEFVRNKVDSIRKIQPKAAVIITGDFNDEPEEASMIEGLAFDTKIESPKAENLYNLMYDIRYEAGTHSFENQWSIIDQFIVSGNLLTGSSSTSILNNTAQIFNMDYLIMTGATGATRPFRTYQGPKYIGGYSDHLPILLDLVLK
ncbi:endonuclease/exonuclease/phosphatase family protein [Roseivirga pacifica]|uniref:endonuclease/exonuclease/phosphatase family protein n=1 Tax=Roseivirga pacifica TaxID=1267423 RepID=UPI0020956397|nr:endonuclease/exonuclease/phosphatase family protein [Roseivirga pacifica]